MKIGIDIMGGDYAPKKIVHGAILAQKELPRGTEIILFGKKEDILSELKSFNISSSSFEIVDCPEVIEMGEHPVKAFKKKQKSSIAVGFYYLAKGEIDGFASAGNTGAMFAGGFFSVKAISGVIRPCISSVLPKENGGVGVLLDVGANADCKADVLYQFGILGSLFAEHVCNIKTPKVGLLNLGEEKTKGNISEDIEKVLDGMLSELRLNYVDEKNKSTEKPEEKQEEKPKEIKKKKKKRFLK